MMERVKLVKRARGPSAPSSTPSWGRSAYPWLTMLEGDTFTVLMTYLSSTDRVVLRGLDTQLAQRTERAAYLLCKSLIRPSRFSVSVSSVVLPSSSFTDTPIRWLSHPPRPHASWLRTSCCATWPHAAPLISACLHVQRIAPAADGDEWIEQLIALLSRPHVQARADVLAMVLRNGGRGAIGSCLLGRQGACVQGRMMRALLQLVNETAPAQNRGLFMEVGAHVMLCMTTALVHLIPQTQLVADPSFASSCDLLDNLWVWEQIDVSSAFVLWVLTSRASSPVRDAPSPPPGLMPALAWAACHAVLRKLYCVRDSNEFAVLRLLSLVFWLANIAMAEWFRGCRARRFRAIAREFGPFMRELERNTADASIRSKVTEVLTVVAISPGCMEWFPSGAWTKVPMSTIQREMHRLGITRALLTSTSTSTTFSEEKSRARTQLMRCHTSTAVKFQRAWSQLVRRCIEWTSEPSLCSFPPNNEYSMAWANIRGVLIRTIDCAILNQPHLPCEVARRVLHQSVFLADTLCLYPPLRGEAPLAVPDELTLRALAYAATHVAFGAVPYQPRPHMDALRRWYSAPHPSNVQGRSFDESAATFLERMQGRGGARRISKRPSPLIVHVDVLLAQLDSSLGKWWHHPLRHARSMPSDGRTAKWSLSEVSHALIHLFVDQLLAHEVPRPVYMLNTALVAVELCRYGLRTLFNSEWLDDDAQMGRSMIHKSLCQALSVLTRALPGRHVYEHACCLNAIGRFMRSMRDIGVWLHSIVTPLQRDLLCRLTWDGPCEGSTQRRLLCGCPPRLVAAAPYNNHPS